MKNEKGQFVETTGSTIYKRVQFRGKAMHEHQRVMCILLGIDEMPKHVIVHHIDKNKKNNDPNNLAIMTTTAHNRMHCHEPWNKGLTTEDERVQNILEKALKTRKNNYAIKKGKEVYLLRQEGLTFTKIGERLNITRGTASKRLQSYLEYKKLIEN